jgi:hypothetical protein
MLIRPAPADLAPLSGADPWSLRARESAARRWRRVTGAGATPRTRSRGRPKSGDHFLRTAAGLWAGRSRADSPLTRSPDRSEHTRPSTLLVAEWRKCLPLLSPVLRSALASPPQPTRPFYLHLLKPPGVPPNRCTHLSVAALPVPCPALACPIATDGTPYPGPLSLLCQRRLSRKCVTRTPNFVSTRRTPL